MDDADVLKKLCSLIMEMNDPDPCVRVGALIDATRIVKEYLAR